MFFRLLIVYCVFAWGWAFANFTTYFVTHKDGTKIRIGLFQNKHKHDKTIIVCPGSNSFIEKNEITAKTLDGLGFNVYVIDWRGQGGSDRLIHHPQKVFIQNYQQYLDDIEATINSLPKDRREKLYLYGGSMGGHVILRFLEENPHAKIKAAILVAPMFDVPTKPFPKFVAKFLAWFMSLIGSGHDYCWGFGDFDPKRDIFERNKNTHNRDIFENQKAIVLGHPKYITAGPTFQWLKATFESIGELRKKERLKKIEVPIFIATAGKDQQVDASSNDEIIGNLSRVAYALYPDSFHHIMHEIPEIREKFIADIRYFLKYQSA